MGGNRDEREKRVTGWLETAAADEVPVRERAGETIVPGSRGGASDRTRALVGRLSDDSQRSASTRIELEERLSEGGMGVVHLGTQVTLGRKVAVKTLKREARSEEARADLLREAWVTGSLEHPNVVPIYDIGLDAEGAPIIALKRIEGSVWSELMGDPEAIRERFGADDALDWNLGIFMQVANAVRFAHTRGIIHRDIKPDNVMIGEFGEVYLLDWGIAVSLRDDPSGRLPLAADATEMAGTLAYMAPEMLGGGELSELTDVYLLGATLYELLTGEPPHRGESAAELIQSITAEAPRIPEGPSALAEISRRAMDPDPRGRFESVQQLLLAVQGYRQHRGSESLVERADEHAAAMREEMATEGDGAERRQRLYRLFGESRFGYREALAQWPRNARAKAGLVALCRAMADYELARKNPGAAANILSELDDPPPEVAELLERARATEASERARIAELEAFGRQYDSRPGRRTRFFLAAVLGGLWTTLPLAQHLVRPAFADNRAMIAFTLASATVTLVLGFWARESLMKTAINRALSGAVMLMFGGQLILYIAAWLLAIDERAAQVLMLGFWTVPATVGAYAVERRLWPAALCYAAGFLVAAQLPETRWVVMSACNFVLLVNALVVWRPK